jgi:hypothetical protein
MTRCRTAVGLSLLCALVFCACAAQSASAVQEKGTTAFFCQKGGGSLNYNDAHCDEQLGKEKEGAFGHVEVKEKIEVEITNAKTSHETLAVTPLLLRSTSAGVIFEVQCQTVSGTGTITNEMPEKLMISKGTSKLEISNCTVIRPENSNEERHPCKVKAPPIVFSGTSQTTTTVGAGNEEMGVNFFAEAGKPFFKAFEFEGANCVLKGKGIEITGNAVATGNRGSNKATESSGATLKFTTAMTSETLKLGAAVAEFSTTITTNDKKSKEPITFLTTKP